MSMKSVFLISGLALAAISQASFELALVLDRGTTGFRPSTVKRYDADTGTFLGSFGSFSNTVDSIAIQPGTNIAFVRDNTEVHRYNFNTGEFLGSFQSFGLVGQMAFGPDGRLYIPDGLSDIPAFNPATGIAVGAFFNSTYGSTQARSIGFDSVDQKMYGISSSFNFGYRFSIGGVFEGATGDGAIPGPHTDVAGQITRAGGGNVIVFGTGTGQARVLTSGSFTTGPLDAGLILTTSYAVAPAHQGFFVGGSAVGGGGRVLRYNNFGTPIAQFGQGTLNNPVSMATVLAPEPGTMAALGLGLAVLLRRRRRS